jgi:Acetamidase/Formamidase family
MTDPLVREMTSELIGRLGRRGFIKAAATVGVGAGIGGVASACTHSSGSPAPSSPSAALADITALQPGQGTRTGDVYLSSEPNQVLWGYVPNVHTAPVTSMRSGQTITIDAVSHEGILEDQGRNPVEFFGRYGVAENGVLDDAKVIAAEYNRTPRDFVKDGPHVVTGPVFVEGAEPGDVLKIETLEAIPRVPYGVVSSRHGKGALARAKDGGPPAGISLEEVMPPVSTDDRITPIPPTVATCRCSLRSRTVKV